MAIKAGLTQSTLQSIFTKRNQPSTVTLEKICDALEISMSDFFNTNENEDVASNNDTKKLLSLSKSLTPNQLSYLISFLESINPSK